MTTQIVRLESSNGVHLPPEAVESLGLAEGSCVAVTLHNGAIMLRPVEQNRLENLRGIFSSKADLISELQQERRQDIW